MELRQLHHEALERHLQGQGVHRFAWNLIFGSNWNFFAHIVPISKESKNEQQNDFANFAYICSTNTLVQIVNKATVLEHFIREIKC